MQLAEEVHPHAAPQVNSKTDARMQKRQQANPDSHVSAQMKADGIWPPPEHVPWPEPERSGNKDQGGIRCCHAQAMALVGRRRSSIGRSHNGCSPKCQCNVPV